MEKRQCSVCSNYFPNDQIISGNGVRNEIEKLIQLDFPGWNDSSYICKTDYKNYKIKYITNLISEETGQIEKLESEVIQTIQNSDFISTNINSEFARGTKGEQISDALAKFGGSWKFIIFFFLVLLSWILINSFYLIGKPFDPFPFILLNLVLSCIAAIQAPVIMMSQNRQEAKDRLRAEKDYKINLKSEIEIRTLHEKMDHLLLEQWSKMTAIQELQIDILNDIREKIEGLVSSENA